MEMLTNEEQDRIVHAISVAENHTSGEIRVVVERKLNRTNALDGAVYYFEKLNMHKTILRNGVLIYLAIDDHAVAILGDSGINDRVEKDFWESTKDKMIFHFKNDHIVEGLVSGIIHAGERLHQFFPRKSDDVNELPNDVYFGED